MKSKIIKITKNNDMVFKSYVFYTKKKLIYYSTKKKISEFFKPCILQYIKMSKI